MYFIFIFTVRDLRILLYFAMLSAAVYEKMSAVEVHICTHIYFMFSAVQYVATEVKSQIDDFKPYIPLIQGLRNPGMRSRHWELLSDELGFPIKPKQTLTFEKCLELGLQNHIDKIAKVAEVAGKEYSIEQVCRCIRCAPLTKEKDWKI